MQPCATNKAENGNTRWQDYPLPFKNSWAQLSMTRTRHSKDVKTKLNLNSACEKDRKYWGREVSVCY